MYEIGRAHVISSIYVTKLLPPTSLYQQLRSDTEDHLALMQTVMSDESPWAKAYIVGSRNSKLTTTEPRYRRAIGASFARRNAMVIDQNVVFAPCSVRIVHIQQSDVFVAQAKSKSTRHPSSRKGTHQDKST